MLQRMRLNRVAHSSVAHLFAPALVALLRCSVYTTLEHEYLGWLSTVGCTLNRDGDRVELAKAKTAARRVPSVLRFECPSEDEADKWQSSMRESIDAANELTEKDERRRSAAFNSSTNIAFTK